MNKQSFLSLTISDHGCCSRSSSSNDSQPSRLLQQSACWSTYWPNVTSTVSFTCGHSTCAQPTWSCSSVSSHWLNFPQRVTFKLCLLTYKCLHGLAPDYLSRFCTLLTLTLLTLTARSWPSSVTFSWRKQTAGTTVLHGQLWTAFLWFFWSDCLEWNAQPGLISKWL